MSANQNKNARQAGACQSAQPAGANIERWEEGFFRWRMAVMKQECHGRKVADNVQEQALIDRFEQQAHVGPVPRLELAGGGG